MAALDEKKLLGLLGLAQRAGKLAVGFSAVEKMVRRGQRPLVLTAQGVGAAQLGKIQRWEPLAGLILEAVDAGKLADAFGRDKLVVVGVADPGFIKGIKKLET